MSGNQPYAAEVKKEALQVESAKAELFKSIEDLRVLTDAKQVRFILRTLDLFRMLIYNDRTLSLVDR